MMNRFTEKKMGSNREECGQQGKIEGEEEDCSSRTKTMRQSDNTENDSVAINHD